MSRAPSSSASSRAISPEASPAPGLRRAASADVHMLVECNGWVFAFASLHLIRVVLDSEVRVVAARRQSVDQARPLPPLAVIAGKEWSAWDLGLMFGQARVKQAWSLFEVAHEGATLRLALRTGRCLAVAPLPTRTALPPGMFRRRRNAVSSAFIVDENMRGASSYMPVGLCVDVHRLWTSSELSLAATTLTAAPEEQRVG